MKILEGVALNLRDENSIVIRSSCGRVDGQHVMYELRIAHSSPTAHMLRKAKAALDLLVQWAEQDEANEAMASEAPLPPPSVTQNFNRRTP